METEAVCDFNNMSKVQLLRGIIVEKLTIAAQEIFAVVETTVVGYETEASALRQELDRQRRQLEVLLLPRVKLERIDVCELATGGGRGAEVPEEEEQHKYEPGVEDSCSRVQMEEDEQDEVAQEHLTEPDYAEASRLSTPTVQSDRKSSGRHRIVETPHYIYFKIRILEDFESDVLSNRVYKKFPVQEFRCPRSMQEKDFLKLLGSTFPQLTAQHFGLFTVDKTKKLQPLKVKTLTPELMARSIRRSGAGNSALYIRLKTQFKKKSTDGKIHPSQREDAADGDSPSTPDQTSLSSPRVQSDERKSGGHSISGSKSLIHFKIHILEDFESDVLSNKVYKKYPVQELRCPRSLQEEDFLDLLRSTFPLLAAQKHFDLFTTDNSKRLQPLRVKTLTPEKIARSVQQSGAGKSALYIRLKPSEGVQTGTEADSAPADQTRLNTRVQPNRSSEPQNHVDLRICLLEDSQISVLSNRVYNKYPVQELRCPRGLEEEDFLDLLGSTFPLLAAQKHFDLFTTDTSKRLQPLRVKTLTPQEITRSIRQSGAGQSALYIRLKTQEEVQDEFHPVDAVKDPSSTSDPTRLNMSSSRSQPEDMETEEADDGNGGSSAISRVWSLLALSEAKGETGEVSGDDWKPDKSEEHVRESEPETPMTRRRRRRLVENSDVRTERRRQSSLEASTDHSDAPVACKVCRVLRGSTNMLIRHAWIHVGDPERLCGVCGEHSESAEELRSHLQSHQKTHICNTCGKWFLSVSALSGHVARHKGKKPYKCEICYKGFAQKWVLMNHKCDVCSKACSSKIELTRHRLTHTGERLHRCNMCGKSLSSLEMLSQHVSTHCRHSQRSNARL